MTVTLPRVAKINFSVVPLHANICIDGEVQGERSQIKPLLPRKATTSQVVKIEVPRTTFKYGAKIATLSKMADVLFNRFLGTRSLHDSWLHITDIPPRSKPAPDTSYTFV